MEQSRGELLLLEANNMRGCWRNYKRTKKNDKKDIYYLHVKIILRDEFGKLTSTSSVKEDGNRDLKSQFSKVTCKGEHR